MSAVNISENPGFVKVRPDDPNRCQSRGGQGQCPFRAIGTRQSDNTWDGPKYCPRHGGNIKFLAERASLRLYLSAKWQERIGFQADHPKVKSLREELGILRITLDSKLNSCRDDLDLAMQAGGITELAREIGKLAKTAHGIESSMATLLDKNQAKEWVIELLDIIGRYISDSDVLQMLSEDMLESLERRTEVKP